MGAIIAAVATVAAIVALIVRRMLRGGERDYPDDRAA
jgi:hypothetical protein